MLKIARNMKELSFNSLMEIYIEGNQENGAERWPEESRMRQIQLAEQDFYCYLTECFFATPGAVYAVWEADGKYVSALRLEPYRDGLLLEALETDPEQRRKGYAAALVTAVQGWLREQGSVKIYSHVSKWNAASLRTHEKCGFQRISESAAYIDGSVNPRSCTMCYEG